MRFAMKAFAVASIVLVSLAAAAPAEAQARRAAKSASEVVLVNARAATLNGLSLTNASGQSVGGISQPIASGKSMRVKLAKGAGCVSTVEASFDDETAADPAQFDVCADKTVRFTD